MQLGLCYHNGDRDQAQRWMDWCAELGGVSRHQLFIMPARGAAAIEPHASAWNRVEFVTDGYGIVSNWNADDPIRDASGPNSMFRQFAWFFLGREKGPWMFCEPDAIPLRATWLDELEAEYIRSGKPYMGAVIPGVTGDYETHATGNGIYPQDAAHNQGLMIPQYARWGERTIEIAFDVASAKSVLPQFASTNLIQQIFRGDPFTKPDDLNRIRPDAAVFHNDKTGGLVQLLREKRSGIVPTDNHPVQPTVAGPETTVAPLAPSKPVVHTYCAWSSDPETQAEQARVLDIWEKNWIKAGWDARILTPADAMDHPRFSEFRDGFARLPIKNPMEYEVNGCFFRWIGMSTLKSGTVNLLVDYDVLTNGFPLTGHHNGISCLHCFCNHVPCATCGQPHQYEEWASRFITENSQSDMHCLERFKALYTHDSTVAEYGTSGWEDAKLIHFAHYACRPSKRSQVMQEWVEQPVKKHEGFSTPLFDKIAPPFIPDMKYHVSALAEYCKKDGFAKGRVRKALKAAKIIA